MKIQKIFHFLSENNLKYDIHTIECLDSSIYSIFTWPSAITLSAYLISNPEIIKDKKILELGAGTSLPSIVCAKLGAIQVFASERADEPELLQAIDEIIRINQVASICSSYPLTWGYILDESLPSFDVVLGSDIFYSSQDFEIIFQTLFSLLARNPHMIFLTSYQERSNKRTISPYLNRYHMKAEVISPQTFLHPGHQLGFCELESSQDLQPILTMDDIYLIKITLKQ